MDFLLHHLLRSAAARGPDREGLVDGTERVSYGHAWDEVNRISGALKSFGLARHDRVVVWLPPCVPQALALFAISAAGGVAVPLHDSLFPRQVVHVAQNCNPKVLITGRRPWESLRMLAAELPSLETVILVDRQGRADGAFHPAQARYQAHAGASIPPQQVNWDELEWDGRRAPVERDTDKDLAAILYTSGSTGRPKGVMLSHGNLIAGASIVSDYLSLTERDRLLGVLPLSFDAGLNQLTTAVQQGGTYVSFSFVLANQIVKALQREQITGLAGVPTLWNLLVQNGSFQRGDFPALRYVTNTGGALPQATLAELRSILPRQEIFLMYGLTEAFRSTYLPPSELDRRPLSMGKAIPNTEIFVVNEAGERCKPGEVGELVHHGPTVSLGYWNEPELTSRVLRPHPFVPAGQVTRPLVCYSGDLVRMDDEGFLYFISRRDNQIKSSGFRVSPSEIEEVLHESGSVAQAAVIGIPDEMLGERIEAIVVPRTNVEFQEGALRDHCAAELPAYMVPKRIWQRTDLPRTANGKTDYSALRQEYACRTPAPDSTT